MDRSHVANIMSEHLSKNHYTSLNGLEQSKNERFRIKC